MKLVYKTRLWNSCNLGLEMVIASGEIQKRSSFQELLSQLCTIITLITKVWKTNKFIIKTSPGFMTRCFNFLSYTFFRRVYMCLQSLLEEKNKSYVMKFSNVPKQNQWRWHEILLITVKSISLQTWYTLWRLLLTKH